MTLRALLCRLSDDTLGLATNSWSGTSSELSHGAGVYLVSEEALTEFLAERPANDRGRKHFARSLSSYLLGQPRTPAVFAPFKSERQAKNSIRTVLKNARARRERKAYVIGIPPALLEKMAARLSAEADDGQAGAGTSQVHIFSLFDPEDVPPELEATLVGDTLDMQFVRHQIVRAARQDVPVLIQGETGTGKELVARSIHELSPVRSKRQFIPVNCGAIPTDLFESQVFGYLRGSFTGADPKGHPGFWRFAGAGTIFLDEIGDLALVHQVKILRALETRKVRPIGSSAEVPAEARVIAATNRDLYAMKESGEFREDLYYRLASMVIRLPTLRERVEDVTRLARLFWKEVAPNRPPLSDDVLRELEAYQWHGNARELRYIVMNLHTMFPKSTPNVERLRAVVRMRAPSALGDKGPAPDNQLVDRLRHLRRARVTIDGCHRIVTGFRRDAGATWRGADEVLVDVTTRLTELQLLGTPPGWFSDASVRALHGVAGALAVLQGAVRRSDRQAARREVAILAAQVTTAASAIRRDEERILKSL